MKTPVRLFCCRHCFDRVTILLVVIFVAAFHAASHAAAPTFASPQLTSTTARVGSIVTGDFDKDGSMDEAGLDPNNGVVEVHFGDGAGGFRVAAASFTVTSTNGIYRGIAAADLDGDGQSELIFAATDSVFVYDRQVGGAFTKTRTIDLTASGVDATKVAVGDLTAAGSRDIVVSDDFGNTGVVWIPNDGMGNFGAPVVTAAGGIGYYARVVLADLDGDGLDDVVLARNADVGVLLNKGDGTLDAEVSYGNSTLANLKIQSVAVVDVDGDHHLDLVATGYTHDGVTLADTFFLDVNLSNAGNGNFGDGKAFQFSVNSGKNINAQVIEAADLNGDGLSEIITTVAVPGTVSANAVNGYVVTRWTGTGASLAVEGQDSFSTTDGASYEAMALADMNGDTLTDVLIGTTSTVFTPTPHSQFALFSNSPPTLPTGRQIQFAQTELDVTEGMELDVSVVRGSASTGQVVAYFTVGGTAVQDGEKVKNPDYSITEPPDQSQAVVFEEGEFQKDIHIIANAAKSAESEQTIILTLLNPFGDAEPIDVANPPAKTVAIVTIHDTKPAGLPKAGGLSVKSANLVKPIPANIAKDVKVAGRTGSDWTFSVSQPFPADAYNPSVKVQYSFLPVALNQWTDYLDLTHGKGSKWSAVDRHPFVCSKLFFRTVASAEGYPEQIGAPTQPFAVIGGPELALNVSAISDSDSSGDTAHENEVITYHFSAANVSHEAAATPAVLTVPIPKHTTFLSATNHNALATQIKDKKGVTTAVVWNFAALATSTTLTEELLVQIDVAGMFSASEQKKHPNGFGTILSLKGQSLSATSQGIKAAPLLRDTFETKILGPIKLTVSRPNAQETVIGGDLITYTLAATNSSANPVSQVILRDRIPLGTTLDSVYVPDGSGNSTNSVLPNPTSASNPALVYVLLQNAKFLGKKKGDEVDIAVLDTDTLNKLVDAKLIAQEVKWPIGSIAANSQVQVKFTVRALYDLADPSAGATPTQLVNDDYDFTISGGISALYGNAPGTNGLTSTVTAAPPATKPVIGLAKIAVGSHDLNNSIVHGNGSQQVADLGEVTTAVQFHGFDFEILYINSGDATAHHVAIHEVIPAGSELLGFFTQSVNGGAANSMTLDQFTYYDATGRVMPNVTIANLSAVRSMDIRLSNIDNLTPLPAGGYGVIRYSIRAIAAPSKSGKPDTFLHSYGGFDPKLHRSDPEQGCYITCADLQHAVPATPFDTTVKIVADVSWNLKYTKGAYDAKPGDIVRFDFDYTQNGDIDASNCHMDLVIPAGTTLLTDGVNAPTFTDVTGGPVNTVLTGSAARFDFATIAAQEFRSLRIFLQVNTPLDPALAAKEGIFFDPVPVIKGEPVLPTFAALRGHARLRAPVPVTASSTADSTQLVPIRLLSAPKLAVARSAPYTVQKGGIFTYTIAFANSGDTAATNVNVGMQIPYFTHFLSATNGIINAYNGTTIVPTPNFNAYTTTPRSAKQVKETGPGPDIITWHFNSLPAHSAGAILLKVQINGDFADDCVKDYSLYASADNATLANLTPNPIGTWVIGKSFDTSKWEVLGCFCEHLNIPINAANKSQLTGYVNALTRNSQVRTIGRLDGVDTSGVSILPLRNGQVMVLGSELVASGGGNITLTGPGASLVASGGGNLVASGGGNFINISNVAGLGGTKTCAYLIANVQSLVASGGGNLIASGGGNLIELNGAGFSQISNLAGGAPISIIANNANLVASGGGNLIASGAGNVAAVGTGLISQDAGTLISQDGGTLISQDGGTLVNHNSGVISPNSSNFRQ